MTEQERAAALADEMEKRSKFCRLNQMSVQTIALIGDDVDLLADALRAYARPAQADLREAIIRLLVETDAESYEDIADAVLSLLPQTQAASDVLADMRETLQRLADLTPQIANQSSADGLHLSVKAIAASAIERLDRAKEG